MISRRTAGWLGAAALAAIFLGIVLLTITKNEIKLSDGSYLRLTKAARGGWHSFENATRFRNFLAQTLPTSLVEKFGVKKYFQSVGIGANPDQLSFFFVLRRNGSLSEEEDSYWSNDYQLQVTDDGERWVTASPRRRLASNWVWVWETPPRFTGRTLRLQLQSHKGTNWVKAGTFSIQNPL